MNDSVLSDIAPFQMHDNIYFIGSSRVSVHLIATECGLVLIDTGYPDMYDQILHSMDVLGFQPQDICAIFHTHGHIDHFGCTERLKALSGAKTYISRIDNEILNGNRELSFASELGYPKQVFDCDVLIEDGDSFTFGKTAIRCCLTPGHTEGTLSLFINIHGEKGSIIAAMHGGIGTNTLAKAYLLQHNLPFENREIFKRGLHALADEHVDLVLGNHPYQNDTVGKLQKVLSGEIILDATEWKRLLICAEGRLNKRIEEEKPF